MDIWGLGCGRGWRAYVGVGMQVGVGVHLHWCLILPPFLKSSPPPLCEGTFAPNAKETLHTEGHPVANRDKYPMEAFGRLLNVASTPLTHNRSGGVMPCFIG